MVDDAANRKVMEFPVGDYPERLDRAYSAAMSAMDDETPTTLLEEHPYAVLKAEYDALAAESREASKAAKTYVVLREVSRGAWRKIKTDHPPRTEGDPESLKADRATGMNNDTAEDDLVFAALVEPEFSSRGEFDAWADQLGAGKFAAIAEQAFLLTVGARRDPKSLPVSPTPRHD